MNPTVNWSIRGNVPVLWVPPRAVDVTSERTFIARVNSVSSEWVDVKKGATQENVIEVIGLLKVGDTVLVATTAKKFGMGLA